MAQDVCLARGNKESIHSGHFMVSDFEVENDSEEIRQSSDATTFARNPGKAVADHGDKNSIRNVPPSQQVQSIEITGDNFQVEDAFDFQSACKETSNTYKFGPRSSQAISIDASLSKLFQCMTLAYSGKLTSPRWKHFKGLKLKWKEKIRLNNVIWRAWHMQFVVRKKLVVCQFATPIDNEAHNKPQAVVLEGKYWKRKMENVIAEYKNWRTYHKNRLNIKLTSEFDFDFDFFKWPSTRIANRKPLTSPASLGLIIDDDVIMDVSDTLFSSISQPFMLPNSREISHGGGLADFIQPGLAQLQPNLDDFMDTFDQLHDSFTLKQFLQDCTDPMQPTSHFSQVDSFLGGKAPNDLSPNPPSMQNIINSTPGAASNNSFAPDSNLETLIKLPPTSRSDFPDINQFQNFHPCQTSISGNNEFNDVFSGNSKIAAFCPNVTSQPICTTTDFVSNFLSYPDTTNMSTIVPNDPQVHALPGKCNVVTQNQNIPFSSRSNDVIVQNPTKLLFNASKAVQQTSLLSNGSNLIQPIQQMSSFSTAADIHSRHFETSATSHITRSPLKTENMLSPLDSSSNIMQSNIYTDTIRPTSSSAPLFSRPKMTAPQAKSRRSSTSAKSSTLRRSSHPSCMRNSKSRTCVPIAPNTGQRTSLASDPNSRKISIVTSTNTTNSSYLPQNLIAQVVPTAYSNVNTLTTPISEPPVAIINTLTSTEAKSDNNLKETSSSSPFTSTVIFSPVALSNMTGMTDFQSRVLLGAANQVFNSSTNQQNAQPINHKLPIPSTGTAPKTPPSPGAMNNNPVTSSASSKSSKVKSPTDQANYKEHRRVVHINAEQKRRFNIKYGFNIIQNLVPSLNKNASIKVSKAQMLQKAADYIRHVKNEKAEMARENERIKNEIEALNENINSLQAQLPVTGAPISSSNTNDMTDMFEEYVRSNTLQNWKFWIFSIIIRPLFEKYDQLVHTTSIEEFCRSVLSWLDQYCSLVYFRPAVSNSLRRLSTTTDILSNPSSVREEAKKSVSQGYRNKDR